MATLNHAQVIGNTGSDPDVRYLGESGSGKVATFSLATREHYKDRNDQWQESTEWHSIVAFRGLADLAEKYIRKGSLLFVEGRLRTRQWTDNTGLKHNKTDIIADNIQLLGSRQEQGGDPYIAGARQMGGGQGAAQPRTGQAQTVRTPPPSPASPAPVQADIFAGEDGDDLPF